jgi:hypothetical protein
MEVVMAEWNPAEDPPEDGLCLTLGRLLINVDAFGFGGVSYAGRDLPVMGFTITCKPGEPLRVSLEPSLGVGDNEVRPNATSGRDG